MRATPLLLPTGLALVVLFAMASPARGDGSVGVVVTGEATMQPQLAAQLETWLRSHGHELISAPLPPEAINTLIDCFVIEDQTCARRVVEKRAKTKSVVFAQVTVAAGATALERTVTLTAYWLDKGKDAIAERRFCERCTDTTLRSTADELMVALAGAGGNRGRLKLSSSPSGARVTIDGKPIGLTPLDYSIAIGDHRVTIELQGRTPETRSVTIKKSQTSTLEVRLAAVGGPSRWKKPLPIAIMGGGAVLAITGLVFVGMDEDLPNQSGPQTKKNYFDSALGGASLAIAGVATIGVGAFLLFRGPRRSTPTVGLVHGGGSVGWAGRF